MFIQLEANEACSPKAGRKIVRVHCRHGVLLLTRTGHYQDFVIRAGQTIEIPRGGRVAIMALEAAQFTMDPSDNRV